MAPSIDYERILSSISPLVTLDESLQITYTNEPFLKEFRLNKSQTLMRPFFSVLPLLKKDRQALLANQERCRFQAVENCEFRLRRRIFGYSLFPLKEQTGMILKNITEIKRLQDKVADLHSRLLNLQEKERQRIAGELHDGVGQTILAAKLNFVAANKDASKAHCYDTGLTLIDAASQELREIYTNLYPASLAELGLEATIRSFARQYLEPTGCKVKLQLEVPDLKEEVQTNLFRIIQELLGNIIKHSYADFVHLTLQKKRRALELRVKDNGHGFDESQNRSSGSGLLNIRRRTEDLHGTVKIISGGGGENQGTETIVRIPLSFL